MNVKEQYWKYSLVTIIVVLGTILFVEFIPFLGGILGACTIYILVRKQMLYLTEKKHLRRSFVAVILLLETILSFFDYRFRWLSWLFNQQTAKFQSGPDPIGQVGGTYCEPDRATDRIRRARYLQYHVCCLHSPEDRAGVDGRNQRFRHQCGRTGADTLFHADWWCQDGKVCLQHFAF